MMRQPDLPCLDQFEALAVELARLAGAEIVAARDRAVAVRYKDMAGADERDASWADGHAEGQAALWRHPVTEVDHNVEALIRARLADRFPDHDVIGEEIEAAHSGTERAGGDFLWAVDPIDGTANFVAGFPLFAASIGLLHRGVPVAGAIWCSTTHALGPGVYHARRGGALALDGRPVERAPVAGVRRRIAGVPGDSLAAGPYNARWTGSAAIECAFVAAGAMAAARFRRPKLWDVAGGAALVLAAGGVVLEPRDGGWAPFAGFGRSGYPAHWQGPLIVGDSETAARALA